MLKVTKRYTFLLSGVKASSGFERNHLTPWHLGGFGDFHKRKQQFSVA